jgi:hypothetical protein
MVSPIGRLKKLLVKEEVSGENPGRCTSHSRLRYRPGDRYDKSIVSLMMIGGVYDEKTAELAALRG